jgi:hypothetical protein
VPGSLIAALVLPLAGAPAGLETRWDTPAACVEARDLPARVAGLTGRASAPAARLVLGAERRGEGWRISLELEPLGPQAAEGLRRTLVGRDCATLTEAVALVVAVQLDPVAAAGVILPGPPDRAPSEPVAPGPAPTEPSPRVRPPDHALQPPGSAPMPSASPPPSGVPSRAPDSRQRSSSRSRPRAVLGFAAAGELGVLPRGAAAFELAAGVAWPRARLELGGSASVGPDATSEQLAAVGGRFRLFTSLLRACGVPSRGRFELPACGGLELGDLRATGTGLRRPAIVDALWVAAVASARPQWVIGPRLALGGQLELVVPMRRHRFATREAGRVHEVAPVALRLGVHVELRLP